MEPRVSVPTAKAHKPAETAAAEPAEEPLAPCSVSHGLRVMPPNQTSPRARAPVLTLANSTAPAVSSRAMTEAVWSKT